MGIPRTVGSVAVGTLPPVPVISGTVISGISFSILKGIATVVLGAGNLPTNGYNGSNGFIPTPVDVQASASQLINSRTGQPFDIHGGVAPGPSGMGQQVTLWGFTTATYFNGKTVTVIDNNPLLGSFRFYTTHADVNSTADAGNTAAALWSHYRVVRLECSAGNTGIIYVGDLNVSATRYFAALSLTGQFSIEVASENIPGDRLWITGTVAADSVQVSTIY